MLLVVKAGSSHLRLCLNQERYSSKLNRVLMTLQKV